MVHATDEEKLAVTNQKWTCVTVDLEADKQDYPQPSDLSTFVNDTKFSSPTEGKPLGGSRTPTLPWRPPSLRSTGPGKKSPSQVSLPSRHSKLRLEPSCTPTPRC